MTNSVPEEFCPITAHLIVKETNKVIDFYQRAFGADELRREAGPDGRLWICELRINGTRVVLHDEFPDMGLAEPNSLSGISVQLHMYVPDADAAYKRAIEAGAASVMEPRDTFWGERYSQVQDPAGHRWVLATKQEDLSPYELRERAERYRVENIAKSQPEEVNPNVAFKQEGSTS